MKSKKWKSGLCLCGLCLMLSAACLAQENEAAALAAADTRHFSKNTEGGWNMYNSYLSSAGNDSVRLELILRQSDSISWQQEEYVGQIKTPGFRPAEERVVSFSLPANRYELRIQQDGKCYLKLAGGPLPDHYPVVIPLRVVYKK